MAKDNYAVDATLWLFDMIEHITEDHFKTAAHIFNNPKTEFDLIIVETLHPLVYSLGCKYRVPIIGVSSLGVFLETHDAVGNPTHPIVAPDILANVEHFSMYEKICSIVHNVWFRIVYYWQILPRNDQIARKYWGECPYLGDIERNVSLVLVNTNPILHPIRPNVPTIVEMGQMHITTKKPLPKELKDYLDRSTEGFIYMSLGSNIRSSNLSHNTVEILTRTFSELPYNVLWKWETDTFLNKPSNVLTSKWFPQQSILGHKNIKVFITQGGLQSMEEAVTNSVPLVGMPFIADQPLNVMKMVKMGIGRSVNHKTMTKETLKEVILDVIKNEKYREKARQLKDLFSDQPMTGLEKSIWWIEYVIRYNGARHLRSSAADMSLIEYFLLDVLALFLIGFTVSVYLFYLCMKIVSKLVRRSNNKSKQE
ncbi:Ecdysteroid UDP-glucosyltransferase-like Protein [Tribolium castaneum]|uniref:UDP-glucuronosyltransferase n=2 Tax=Tribolium castaneum TaxID=7070 RepID=A0A139WET7_TRICA|nr:Ecdysteroid UDP-glucosyltransferase-like Protein [Tribolium castaneum]